MDRDEMVAAIVRTMERLDRHTAHERRVLDRLEPNEGPFRAQWVVMLNQHRDKVARRYGSKWCLERALYRWAS